MGDSFSCSDIPFPIDLGSTLFRNILRPSCDASCKAAGIFIQERIGATIGAKRMCNTRNGEIRNSSMIWGADEGSRINADAVYPLLRAGDLAGGRK
jgi:hypothetical protein